MIDTSGPLVVAGEAVALTASALAGVIAPSVEATVGAADFFAAAAGVDVGEEAVVCAGDAGA